MKEALRLVLDVGDGKSQVQKVEGVGKGPQFRRRFSFQQPNLDLTTTSLKQQPSPK
jgi:hypothetical protein